jgi:hypothetical protein
MFVFLTTPEHGYTVEEFVRPPADDDVPPCRATTYAALVRSTHAAKAVHVFTDLERLSDSELVAASGLYRALRQVGIPCLNDPARVMGRYQLLCRLFAEGINPFAVYCADGQPKPAQFPVFVRNESNHDGPLSHLIEDQKALDTYLEGLVEGGRPLRGLLVVEYAGEPLPSGIWRKTGTYRIGKNYAVGHQFPSDNWVVKGYGQHVTNEALQLEERAAVVANDVPENVRRAFDIAGIEWGRADHTTYRGREIVFEINTAPVPWMIDRYGNVIRAETKRIKRARIYGLMRDIDWGDGTPIPYRQGNPILTRIAESRHLRSLLKPIWRRLPESRRRLFERLHRDRQDAHRPNH